MTSEQHYKSKIAEVLHANAEQIFLYWKGRVALYALLKAMGIKPGDEVIIPAFTCVVVPNAIIYLGAKPIYVDIDPSVLNPTKDIIEAAINTKTKCIIIQNTFGLSHQVEEIVSLAKEKGIYTLEDCTHGFGGTYQGKANGSYCDAAFYSTQWNKPFSTGVGGFAMVNNTSLLPQMHKVNTALIQPTWKQRNLLGVLIKARRFLLNNTTYWFLLKMYRSLSKLGWFVGSSSDVELTSTAMPKDYFMASSTVQNTEGLRALSHLDELLKTRKINAARYHAFMKTHDKWHYPDAVLDNHSFLKFPILVKNRDHFMQKAEKAKIQMGDWFLSPIHPIEENWDIWQLTGDMVPKGLYVSKHIVNLPTDAKNTKKVLRLLKDNKDELL